jgi:hypothetical protein
MRVDDWGPAGVACAARQLESLAAQAVAPGCRILGRVSAVDQRGQQPMCGARMQPDAAGDLYHALGRGSWQNPVRSAYQSAA